MAIIAHDTVKAIKDLRVSIDEDIKRSQKLSELWKDGSLKGARELALVITKLEEAKMWAGKILEQAGNKLPEEFRDEGPEAAFEDDLPF